MLTEEAYRVTSILKAFQAENKSLVNLFPRLHIYSTIELGTIYESGKKKHVETPIFQIQLLHVEIIADDDYAFLLEESINWSELENYEDVYIYNHEQASIIFTTFDDFDKCLIPEHIKMFTNDYSDSNQFQIVHLYYERNE